MGLNNSVIKAGATSLGVTGGTDVTFKVNGVTVPNGIQLHNEGQADFRIRENLTAKNRSPVAQKDGTYTKGKKQLTLVMPKLLASGVVQYNLIRIETEIHPETTAAEALDIKLRGAQLLSDSDYDGFWAFGSLV